MIFTTTQRASHLVRPAQIADVLESNVRLREVAHCLKQRRRCFSRLAHAGIIPRFLSQVYYRLLETVPGKGVQLVFPINISGKGLATFNMTEDYLQKLYLAGKIRPAEVAPHA